MDTLVSAISWLLWKLRFTFCDGMYCFYFFWKHAQQWSFWIYGNGNTLFNFEEHLTIFYNRCDNLHISHSWEHGISPRPSWQCLWSFDDFIFWWGDILLQYWFVFIWLLMDWIYNIYLLYVHIFIYYIIIYLSAHLSYKLTLIFCHMHTLKIFPFESCFCTLLTDSFHCRSFFFDWDNHSFANSAFVSQVSVAPTHCNI